MELSGIRYVDEMDVEGKTVFVRVDFNVPIKNGTITDDARIRAALPTLQYLRDNGAVLVLASHMGRPKGQRDEALSLVPAGERLAELLETEVICADDCVGDGVKAVVRDRSPGEIVLLENLRFHVAEKKGDSVFAAELASLADLYVNDAFGTAHRAHASTYTMVQHFKETEKASGFLIKAEIEHLGPLLREVDKPYVGIFGGAKVSDKIAILKNFIGRADTLLVGGAMAYTLLKAKGVKVGSSLVEEDKLELAAEVLKMSNASKTTLVLPSDHIVADSIDASDGIATSGANIDDGLAGFDIGPNTLAAFKKVIDHAQTIVWNGPMGVFEKEPFAAGTMGVAHAVADADATVVIGGGDSASAIKVSGRLDDVTHVSTGGGASLEFLEGKALPGLSALRAGHKFE